MKIGKLIGGFLYIHKDYVFEAPIKFKNYFNNLYFSSKYKHTIDHFLKNELDYKIIKIGESSITLLKVPNFDFNLNPSIISWITFDTSQKELYAVKFNSKTNPLLLHKKETMVKEDYLGFDVKKAKSWTEFYENSNIALFKDKKRIGRSKYWFKALKELKEKYPTEYDFFVEKNDII